MTTKGYGFALTVIVAEPVTPSLVTEIDADPAFFGVTSACRSYDHRIVATDVSLDAHVIA